MLMPGRSGSLIQGEWTEGGNAVLANLTVDDRSENQPVEYVATESIEFMPGFESGDEDAFVAYIDPEATSGNGGEGSGLYRYGFNGKENDNEVKGEGNQQDYGMRIYDGRLGRFLSVDPLTKGYPELTPYQFASNSPLSGIDLDGLEYLGSNTARVEIVSGIVKLKISNMHSITKFRFSEINENPHNWTRDEIGINTTIGSISLNKIPINPLQNNEFSDDPTHNVDRINIQNPIAESTKQPDRRFKQQSVGSSNPVAVRKVGATMAAIDAIIIVGTTIQSKIANNDMELALKHSRNAADAIYDVNTALQEGLIPEKYQNIRSLSDIANVVLSGVISSTQKDERLISIGKEIFNKVSKRRFMYDGQITIQGTSDMKIMQYPKPNPLYNPEYGQEGSSGTQDN